MAPFWTGHWDTLHRHASALPRLTIAFARRERLPLVKGLGGIPFFLVSRYPCRAVRSPFQSGLSSFSEEQGLLLIGVSIIITVFFFAAAGTSCPSPSIEPFLPCPTAGWSCPVTMGTRLLFCSNKSPHHLLDLRRLVGSSCCEENVIISLPSGQGCLAQQPLNKTLTICPCLKILGQILNTQSPENIILYTALLCPGCRQKFNYMPPA